VTAGRNLNESKEGRNRSKRRRWRRRRKRRVCFTSDVLK
jgi:hypothetical protein